MFKLFCRLWFRLGGWGFDGQLPDREKYIIVVGPHTSNWDFICGVAARSILKTDIKFIGKRELFKFPFKNFFLNLGGYPVNRQANENAVEMMARFFGENERFILTISPEGTRSRVSTLRTGFYHVARSADVPYVLVGMDYKRKKIVIAPPREAGERVADEVDRVRRFFAQITAKNPELAMLE